MKIFNVLVCYFLLSTVSFGQTEFLQLDSLMSEIESKDLGMGTLAISKNGQVIYSRSIGFADIEEEQKANNFTKYRIGSLSKTFTATVILKLIEEKKLKLSSKLSKFYPEFPDAKKITIEHLLSHRSGLFNFTNAPGYFSYNHLPQTKEQLLSRMKMGEQQFKPGEQFQYSNTNFVLLTYIAEDVTDKDFSELIEDIVINPLELKRTSFGGTTDTNDNEALSYNNIGVWTLEKSTDMSVPEGAGAIESTPEDINVFLRALFHNELLSDKTMKRMTAFKDSNNYGLGVYLIHTDSLNMLGHTGGVDGFQTFGFYNDSLDLNVTYISNATSYPAWDIFQNAVQAAIGNRFEYPELESQDIPEEGELEDFVGVYTADGFPIDLEVKVKEGELFAQATGQGEFSLTKIGLNLFEYEPAGIKMMFDPKKEAMILVQQGVRVDFKRK